jgi:hypothetical protein
MQVTLTPVSDPYIVRSANITVALTCTKMIKEDSRTIDLQAKCNALRTSFRQQASEYMRQIAILEHEAALKHRFTKCIRNSAAVMETCCLQLVSIHLENAGSTKRSIEEMSNIVLIRCMVQHLEKHSSPNTWAVTERNHQGSNSHPQARHQQASEPNSARAHCIRDISATNSYQKICQFLRPGNPTPSGCTRC